VGGTVAGMQRWWWTAVGQGRRWALWPEQFAPAMVEGGGAGAGRAEGEEVGEWDAWCAGWGW
jgi:hypothetical protein